MLTFSTTPIYALEGSCPSGFNITDISEQIPDEEVARAAEIDNRNGVFDGEVCTKAIQTPRGTFLIIIDNLIPL